jgi:soluble lytic murein transglycosylase-like protein
MALYTEDEEIEDYYADWSAEGDQEDQDPQQQQAAAGQPAAPSVSAQEPEEEPELSIEEAADRAGRFYQIPRGLRRSLWNMESGFQQYNAKGGIKTSQAGARGIGQLMRGTADEMEVDPDDPYQNVIGSARYLRKNFDYWRPKVESDEAAWRMATGTS